MLFSLQELRAQVNLSDCPLFDVHLSVCFTYRSCLLLQNNGCCYMAGILPIGRKTQDNQSKLCSNFNQVWHREFLVKAIQVCSNKGPHLFPIGDDSKNTLMTFKVFSKTNEQFLNIPWPRGIKCVQM